MAHPKRRISKARKRAKRSHLALDAQPYQKDPRSGSLTRPHRINEKDGTHYGFEKGGSGGREVFEPKDF